MNFRTKVAKPDKYSKWCNILCCIGIDPQYTIGNSIITGIFSVEFYSYICNIYYRIPIIPN